MQRRDHAPLSTTKFIALLVFLFLMTALVLGFLQQNQVI